MKKEIVLNGKGFNYLGEFMKDLPENVMLNKVTTGCGMTSVVLGNDVKYVVAMPYVGLIKDKLQWCKERGIEVCSVYHGGNNEDDVMVFKGNKIMTTYDSLEKVTDTLEKRGDLKDWKVCVDEAHKLVDSAAFRPNAIKSVLDNYPKYKAFVFGTATPIKDKYQLPALKNIQKARIDWGELDEVQVNYTQYDSRISDVVALLSMDFLDGNKKGNAHIFINSVRSITSIITKLKRRGYDVPENIRIVCADNDRNYHSINMKLGGKYAIEQVGSVVKKINFYTATAFEGCDIFDEDGKNFIVTDGGKDYTKIDIVTLLPQIIGRIRNSKHKGIVDLIYSKNDYISDVTEKEYEIEVKKMIDQANVTLKDFNSVSDMTKEAILEGAKTNSYLIVDGNSLEVNESSWYNEMHNFSTLKNTYYVSKSGKHAGISDGKKNFNGIDYNYKGLERIEIKGYNKIKLGVAYSFRDVCEDYFKEMKGGSPFMAKIIRDQEPLIGEAYNILGEDKMRALKLRKGDIKKALIASSITGNFDWKIVKLLNLKIGKWYSNGELKNKLQRAFQELRIGKIAKANSIKKWYNTNPKQRRIDGKGVNGLVVVTCNVRITDSNSLVA